MDTPQRKKEKSLIIGLVGLIIVIIILAMIGFFMLKPGDETIQGQAEATQVRVSGKLPGRIVEFMVEDGQSVHKGDTLVRIFSSDAEAKLMQASAMENVYKAQNQKVDKGARIEVINSAYDMWQKAIAGLDIAKKSYDRMQALFKKGVISAQKRDEAEANYNAMKATESAAKSQYEMAKKGAQIEVLVEGTSVAKGTDSLEAQLPMHGGNNKVHIRVTSPNGKVDKVYVFDIAGNRVSYLSDMSYDDSKSSTDYGAKAVNDRTTDGNKITLRKEDGTNQVFEKGIGGHASCTIVYNIAGLGFTNFSTYVGIDQEITKRDEPSAVFRIYGDGALLAESGTMTADTPMEFLSVSVEGVSELKLVADKLQNNWSDHVDFADAKLSASLPAGDGVYDPVSGVH